MAWEKDINGVVYFWQWLLYTRVIGVVESPTTVTPHTHVIVMSPRCAIGRSWVTRKVVCVHVVAVFQIVHELWVVSHESFTCFTTSAFTLYTYYIELSTGGHTFFLFLRFKCPYHLSCPRLSTSATLTRLGKRQFRIFGQLEYNYNTIFVYTIQYNTIFGQFGMQQPDACTWAGLNNSTILKPSKWRHCDPEHCKKEMKILKRA